MALMFPGAPRAASPDPGLVSTALDVAERLAADATDVLTATTHPTGARGNSDSCFDWVRDTGHTLERHTRRVLGTEFPDLPVTCLPARPSTPPEPGYHWLAAPLAGSENYVAGLPWCAYSLALADSAGPLVGVVADAFHGQVYTAVRGRGLRVDGIAVRPRPTSPDEVVVCTELTGAGPWPGLGPFVERANRARAAVRVLGSPALSVTQVALGRAAAAALPHYREPEVAASVALAVEAGAIVLDGRAGQDAAAPTGLLVCAPALVGDVVGWWTGRGPDATDEPGTRAESGAA